MLAVARKDLLVIRSHYEIEGEYVCVVDCEDYEVYERLPGVIEANGKLLGKAGWNSDKGYCCYKERVMLGKVIDRYG
jgi:hypothetical protein